MSSAESSSSQPLLQQDNTAASSSSNERLAENLQQRTTRYKMAYDICRQSVRNFLSSRAQHYVVLGLVSFDLLGIFADIIINLYQCDYKNANPRWDDAREGLGIAGLIFSCLFLLELILSVWAFGWRYFQSKFHCFDAAVIIASFITDVLLHGVLEEVASLVIILRLWRFFKIIEEFSVGAEEQMEGLERRIEQLEVENGDLKRELRRRKGALDDEERGELGGPAWKGPPTGDED